MRPTTTERTIAAFAHSVRVDGRRRHPAVAPPPLPCRFPVASPPLSRLHPEGLHVIASATRPAARRAVRPFPSLRPGRRRAGRIALVASALAFAAAGAYAAPTPDEIDGATYDGGTLPDGQSGLTVKVQVLLDRAGISPGVIDGYKGGMSESAIRAFEAREGLEPDGAMDGEVWSALGGPDAGAVTLAYTITAEDADVRGEPLPDDYAKLAELDAMGFVSVAEKLAERFHMDVDFLAALNEGMAFEAGETITVVDPGGKAEGSVASVTVDKASGRLVARDAEGNTLTDYPVAVGSSETPSPSGTVEVTAIAFDPTYSYRPSENFQQGDNDEPLTLPPGPNGPVGAVWIDLSEPTYGIHGTPEPAKLFTEQSHGCVRMSNWDANELADMIERGATVEFIE